MTSQTQLILAACERWWATYHSDCSGFAKAVAHDLGIELTGMANDIVDQAAGVPWEPLASGAEAAEKAETHLVIGGLKAAPHGHVVIVVPGPLAQDKYPMAYWGALHGVGRKAATGNWSWNANDRDRVVYACHPIA